MRRVTGIGGIFFKASDPAQLTAWYENHLGLPRDAESGGIEFTWRDENGARGQTVWASFPRDTDYFAPSRAEFMINYRVDDLDALLRTLRAEGVAVDDRIEAYPYGRFGWVTDPEGNRVELWEPPKA